MTIVHQINPFLFNLFKNRAVEIAMQGTQGFSPANKDYNIPSIPGKWFSGYHILAYYYVSWALAMPDKVQELQLPFDREFELAKQMKNKKQP
jgi:hypothetical protein